MTAKNEMTEAERLAERTPERIWLIDMGDCISWCDDPDPAGTGEEDAVEYVRATLIRAQSARIAALEDALSFYACENNWVSSGFPMSMKYRASSAELDRGNKARLALGKGSE